MRRWRPVHVSWEGDMKVGGRCAWEGGTHGRRAARVGEGQHAKVRAKMCGGGLSHVRGGPGHADGGHGAWEA